MNFLKHKLTYVVIFSIYVETRSNFMTSNTGKIFTIRPRNNNSKFQHPHEFASFLQTLQSDAYIDIFDISDDHATFMILGNGSSSVPNLEINFNESIGKPFFEAKNKISRLHSNSYLSFSENVETNFNDSIGKSFFESKNKISRLPSNSYLSFNEIESFLDKISRSNRRKVKKISIGKTFEGRHIWMIKILPPKKFLNDTLKTVFVEGGIHAREWISPSVCLYLIENLIKFSLTDNTQYLIVPVVNPDGYVYSHTVNRLWRKNRKILPGSSCVGVDVNRNFGYHFGGEGSSANPCSSTYRGKSSFSEEESKAIRKTLLTTGNVVLYLSIHSYSQLILYPWGYSGIRAPYEENLKSVARKFVSRIYSVNNVNYKLLKGSQFYAASGVSTDWAYAVLRSPLTFTLELRDRGSYGFILPSNQIEPTRKEIWAGFKYLMKWVQNYKL